VRVHSFSFSSPSGRAITMRAWKFKNFLAAAGATETMMEKFYA
jgi:hypothetical protein